ncbi:MAG TPA: hypothetical protein VHL77_05335 [Ferruginibacter sp.]|nr:hypothetical protein [Ferruginibacter sp.]
MKKHKVQAMITEERIKKARKQLRSGIPQGEIMHELRNEGYSDEDVEQVFKLHKPDMRNWYLFFGIVFFIAGIIFFSLILVVGSAILLSMFYAENRTHGKQ